MVKLLLLLTLTFEVLLAQSSANATLDEKIRNFLSPSTYAKNRGFINVVFEPKSAFYRSGRVDVIAVMRTLKENGLLHLAFREPKNFTLHFKTDGAPLFFVKVMSDALQNIGYFRYTTVDSSKEASSFTWSIAFRSDHAIDPLLLHDALRKSGAKIIDIGKKTPLEWSYTVDIDRAYLNVKKLHASNVVKLPHSRYAHWLNVSAINSVDIKSSARNRWYPYIAFYDASLHLVDLQKRDRVTKSLHIEIPSNAKYMKISDIYTLKNVKDLLTLSPR